MQGHFLFDEQLIADTIAYFKTLDGRDLTPQEAERYLVSLADWWDWMVDSLPSSPLPEILRSGFDPVQQRGMGSAASSESEGGERAKRAAPEPAPSSFNR
jgi:hypothetical protein